MEPRCDCEQGYECIEGCDAPHESHTCKLTPEPTPMPTPEPTVHPTPEPTMEPTPDPTPVPTTPAPTPDPTPEPTPEPTPDPTPAPTPHPCDDGSHGCDKGPGGICNKVEGGVDGEGWACDCKAPEYECVDGCDSPHEAHTCAKVTEAPTPSPTPEEEPTYYYYEEEEEVMTAEPTPAPTPKPHPCDDGSHGCDMNPGGICFKVEDGEGVNGEGWICDCDPPFHCVEGCDMPHEGHKCALSPRPTPEPTAEPTAEP